MADKYLCHKSTDPRKVVPKKRRDVLTMDYIGENYRAYFKYDGCQAITILYADGRMPLCLSRTGEEYVSFLPAARQLAAVLRPQVNLYNGLVVFSEAWKPDTEFRHLSGAFRRGQEDPELQLRVWDAVTIAEFDAGKSHLPFATRLDEYLFPLILASPHPLVAMAESWAPGTYGNPQDLSNTLVKGGGADGAVFRDMLAGWEKGKENGDESLKVKSEVSLALRVIDVHEEPGAKTGRPVFTITVEYRGARTKVGSGMPHERDAVPKVGDIVEVLCMEVRSNSVLREPRYKGKRDDVHTPDA